eukprot:4591329-Prymnesium_polylepis.1
MWARLLMYPASQERCPSYYRTPVCATVCVLSVGACACFVWVLVPVGGASRGCAGACAGGAFACEIDSAVAPAPIGARQRVSRIGVWELKEKPPFL